MFEHAAPMVVVKTIPRYKFKDVSEDIAITFVGSRTEWKNCQKSVLDPNGQHRNLLKCNRNHIMTWLPLMRSLHHPAYTSMDDSVWNTSDEALEQIETLSRKLVHNAHCIEGDDQKLVEMQATDDAARVRPQGESNSCDREAVVDGVYSVFLTPRHMQPACGRQQLSAQTAAAAGLANAIVYKVAVRYT